jgi:(S)-3,5-dihydroxyphenylglycine transaminase
MLLACDGRLSAFNAGTTAYYARAMRSTLEQLALCFPAARRAALGVDWNHPDGGFFLTVRVPFPAGNEALTRSAQDFGVIWTPMSYFYPQGGGERAIRLSISYLSDADVIDGIARLSRFIEAEARCSPDPGSPDRHYLLEGDLT